MATSNAEQTTGRPQRLATYSADVGERVIVGQRVDGSVRISDMPKTRPGRSYLVEDELTSIAEIKALVADYVAKAQALGWVPMQGW